VVGGGPAGCLAAAHLARLGATVTVYEAAPLVTAAGKQPGWMMVLNRVSGEAIVRAGLNPTMSEKYRCRSSILSIRRTHFFEFLAMALLDISASSTCQLQKFMSVSEIWQGHLDLNINTVVFRKDAT
jgi:2-polyprenyl-6-methoxyphenol hydroxylase-like FAD-dependent oxidoreductase